jgi:hypothetical protein
MIYSGFMADGYTQDDLRQLAAKHGHKVSDVQFGQWHRFGLLPEPDRRWLGKSHGSAKAIYPPAAAAQLVRLCQLRKEKRTRRLDHLAWYLWWEGYDVPMGRIREFLEGEAHRLDGAAAGWRAKSPEERQSVVEAEFGEEKRLSADETLVSRARRRVGKKALPNFLASLLPPLPEDKTDPMQVVKGFGLQSLFGTLLGQRTLGASDAGEVIEASRKALSTPCSERLAALSDADLRTCRNHLQEKLAEVEQIGIVARQQGGRSAKAWLTAILPTKAVWQARYLVFLEPLLDDPAYRGPKPPNGTLTVMDFAPTFELLELLVREVPILGEWEVLTPRIVKLATHDAARLDRLARDIQYFAKRNPDEFEAFLAAHPEKRAMLYPADSTKGPSR